MRITRRILSNSVSVTWIVGLAACLGQTAFGALNVTTTADPNYLANAILGQGVTLNSASYSGAAVASGTFTGAQGVFSFDSGIVLATGAAATAGTGVNSAPNTSRNNSMGGDGALSAIAGVPTFDAAKLTLDFTISPVDRGNLYFNFVFASEEYNEYSASSFNDVFAFLLDGQNIGLLPNGSRIAVNSVNASVNSQYFIPNRFGDSAVGTDGTAGPYPFEYDGFTTTLTAQGLDLAPGHHTIELAIADGSDNIYDSAVFVQSGTFSSIPTPAPEPSSALLFSLIALPLAWKRIHRSSGARSRD